MRSEPPNDFMNDNGGHISSSRGQKWGARFIKAAMHPRISFALPFFFVLIHIFTRLLFLLPGIFTGMRVYKRVTLNHWKIQYNKKSNHHQQENELLNTKQDQVEISLEKENWIHRIYQWTSIIIIILAIVVVIFSGGCCLLDSCAWSPIYPPISLCKADFEVLYN